MVEVFSIRCLTFRRKKYRRTETTRVGVGMQTVSAFLADNYRFRFISA